MLDRFVIGVQASLLALIDRTVGAPEATDHRRRDRGDVPGWVMITVMTAIVVVALLIVFKQEVENALRAAFGRVNDSDKKG